MSNLNSLLRATIADKLRHRRMELGISQGKASELCGLHKSSIHEYENNLTQVSAINLYKLSKAYKVQMEYFFEGLDAFGKELKDKKYKLEEPQMIVDYEKEEIYYG